MEFKEFLLGDLCEIKSSKRIYAKEYQNFGIPFYRSKEIIQKANNENISTELYISEERYKEIKEKFGSPKNGDILLTSVGTLGISYLVKNEEFYFKDGNLTWFSNFSNKLNNEFLYYWFNSQIGKNEINRITIGSTQKALTIVNLKAVRISLPTRENQIKIVYLLKSLNKKLENNLRIIANLEELSRALFKHWFIDFEFPNEEGKPYKSSGGEMVESELGEIPGKWSVGIINDIAYQKTAKINLDKTSSEFNYIGLEHMPQGSIALGNWESSNKVSGNKSLFEKNDILFGKLRPYFKKVGIASVEGVCSTDIIVVNTEVSYLKSYLFLNLIQDDFIQYTSNTATGTRMPRTSWRLMSNYKIVLPDKNILIKFEEATSSILQKVNYLIHENKNLQQLRDTLLPKLLSGEIEIPDDLEV